MLKNNLVKKILSTFFIVGSLALGAKEYIASGEGYNGSIQVKVEVENKAIKNIEVVKHEESNFTKRAMKTISEEIIANQSLDVDNVAGATYTSEGLKSAVGKAVAMAGVTLKKLDKSIVKNEELKDISTDVVVVGGGGAGLSAAIAANENGAKVILLEKMAMVGGNTNYATGGINAANTDLQKKLGIEDSEELFYQDTMKGGKNLNNKSLVKKMTDESKNAVSWLIEKGTDLTEVSFSGGQSVKRIHRPTGGKAVGPVIVDALNSTLEKKGIEIRTNSEVVKILKKDGKITGVVVKKGDKQYEISAKAVVMATGGFGANPEMVTKYNPALEGFGSTNNPAITGEGIKLVVDAGGALIDMKEIQTHPTVVHNKSDMITESVRGEGAILVNRDGQRFINELETRDVVSKAELSQKGKSAFLVFDQGVRENLSAINGYVKKGLTVQADTLEELAKKIGVNSVELTKTLNKYNEFVKNKEDLDFAKKGLPRAIVTGPFYAIEVSPAIHHTMGGVHINDRTEVLGEDGKVIEGLYAAGEITGGVHGANRIGGNAVTDIVVFGKIAGENSANFIKK
ncbi:flavocytochrome c [Cetobacterium sp. 2A]|uniref:flavocytochrome c n=1 Tax=Cetobacterium sp. 2A TaxID=2754723 RepID=UPI00163C80B3|nr:flavocytochrome c [Cetobacterium sp. 2A]MBC2857338.1 flavocytochrome c [Cetobacterium sp. 2A]